MILPFIHTPFVLHTFIYNLTMETVLLQTKLYIPPPRDKAVPRPRLEERLNEGLHRKLTLISAPAGFGKTTLISERVATCKQQSAWVSLDEGDNDPIRFLTYIVRAVQTVSEGIGEGVLCMLQSPHPPPVETIMATLLNEITTVLDNFILVLDDYHVIESKAVDDVLAFLLEHAPAQMHFVITTREDPLLPLARYRVRGELTEIRATDLRFTPVEAADFLNRRMELNLSEEDVLALETRTEGWIAGLQLAAISMQGQDAGSFIQSFTGSHRFVLDYLVEEVLQQQPENVREFLLRTSILKRLSAPLCDALLLDSAASGKEMLKYLEHANLLIVPLDNERRWYRYHYLFVDVLQARLMEKESDLIPTLHRRASEWYEQKGLPPEAIRHALAARDFERAADLIELAWPAMDQTFQSKTWLGWAKSLPDDLVRARPVLSVDYAWAYLNDGELDKAESRLQDAERWLDTPPSGISPEMAVADEDRFPSLPASIATARSYAALALGDIPNTLIFARQALDFLPEDDYLGRGPAASLLGLAYWANGDLEAAYQVLADAMTGFQKNDNIIFAISGTYGLADIRIAQGRLHDAINIYERSLQLARAQGEPAIPGTTELYFGLSKLYREQGLMDAAEQNLSKSEELGEPAALADWSYRLRIARARIKQSEGDLNGALDLLDEAERLYFNSPVPEIRPVSALKTQVWIAQGRLAESLKWAQERGLSVDGDLSYLHEFELMTLARILIARYQKDREDDSIHKAIRLIERLLEEAKKGERTGSVIEILLLQALAYEAQGDIPLALDSLEHALTLAEPEGYIRTFVDEGLPMAQLLSKVTARRGMSAYVSKLLAVFEEEKQKPGSLPAQAFVDPLSERELEILALIAAGLKNKEIAGQFFISLNTVLYHIKNIYSKLGVKKRTLAILKARELHLLPEEQKGMADLSSLEKIANVKPPRV